MDESTYAKGKWKLAAYETPVVYFAAGKTITVSGTDRGKVAVYTSGSYDGKDAGAELAFFKVDTDGGDYFFETPEYEFTLTVSEAGKDDQTIPVTLSAGHTGKGAAQ